MSIHDPYRLTHSDFMNNIETIKKFVTRFDSISEASERLGYKHRQSLWAIMRTGRVPVYAARIIADELGIDVQKIRPDLY